MRLLRAVVGARPRVEVAIAHLHVAELLANDAGEGGAKLPTVHRRLSHTGGEQVDVVEPGSKQQTNIEAFRITCPCVH